MTMEDDNRPGENPDEEEPGSGWYFDLPQGAWERQEAKNRDLRQTVRRNINEESPKDVFGGVRKDDPAREDASAPLAWGAEQSVEPAERPLNWTPPAQDDAEPDRPSLRLLTNERAREATEAEPDYSTEPDFDSPAPFALRSQRVQEDDEPRLKPPAGLFGYEPTESDASPLPDIDAGDQAEPPYSRGFGTRFTRDEAQDEPTPFIRGDREQPVEPERPRSRWGELFSDKASDGASMLDGMRNWAQGDHEPAAHEPVEQARDVDDRIRAQSGDEPPAITPIPIRIQHHDADEPPLVNSEEPRTRWDHMFAGKAADGSGMLEGMRAWSSKPQDEEDPGPPRLPSGREHEPNEQLFEPFAWERGARPTEATGARLEERGEEKKGLFGKLFGKKKQAPEPPAVSAYAPDARLPAEDSATHDEVVTDDDASRGMWLGRSDGDENRFDPADRDLPWPPVERPSAAARASGWGAEDEDDESLPVRLPQDDLPVPVDSAAGADRPAAWLDPEPSDDDRNRFSELSSWFTHRNDAAVEVAEKLSAPLEPVAEEPLATSDTALERWEPASWESPTDYQEVAGTTDAERHGDEERVWEPEPLAASTAHEVLASEPPALPSDPDEDPWAPLQAVDDEAEEPPPQAYAPAEDDELVAVVASMDEPEALAAAEPDSQSPDDPWSVYLDRPDADAPADAPEAAPSMPSAVASTSADKGESLWDSAFARVHDDPLAEEAPVTDSPAEDPWEAIAKVAGYDESPAPGQDFNASAEVASALDRYETEREAEEAYTVTTAETFPSAVEPTVDLPAWDDSQRDDDTVLRAFQAHASYSDEDEFTSSVPSATDNDTLIFDELLGEDAEEIVSEASQPAADNRYFGRMQGWAPQRTPGERQPFPWEKDLQEPARVPDAREEADSVLQGWGRTAEAPPPWDSNPVTAPAAHADAPSVRRKSRSRVLVREIVETGLLALLVFLSVRASFQNFKVDGYSMWPTLDDGEYLIVNKLAYSEVDMDRLGNFVPFVSPGDDPTREVFGGPSRGDIVVLKDPRETNTDLIKRIIGLPGETLQIVDGKVYINDKLLVEPYIKEEWNDDKEKIAIPEGFYFVMGDNRNNSMDSRSSQIALISKDLLIGKAMVTYWPRDKFGLAPNDGGSISAEDGPPVVTTERVPE